MKVAVQLYGHLRTYDQCFLSLKKHLLDKYECDIFIHTWDRLEHTTKTWYETDTGFATQKVDNTIIGEINKLYAPKGLQIDTQNFIDEPGLLKLEPASTGISLTGIKYMLYSQNAVNNLRTAYEKQTGVKYDMVVTTRPDIKLLDDLVLEKYKNEFDFDPNTTIHFLFGMVTLSCQEKIFAFGTMDLLFLAKPEVMSVACNCYNEFDRFYKTYPRLAFPNGEGCPEVSFHEYLARHTIAPRFYRTPICLKRKEDKNDIVYNPPKNEPLPTTAAPIEKPTLIRRSAMLLIRILRKLLPDFVKRKMRRLLQLALRYLHQIESL